MATVVLCCWQNICRLANKSTPLIKSYPPSKFAAVRLIRNMSSSSPIPTVQTVIDNAETTIAIEKSSSVVPIVQNVNADQDIQATETVDPDKKVPYIRIKKRKVVLLMSYSGQGFYGMQKNPDTRTIEDELLKALLKANYIDEDCYKRPQLLNFQRAARTDKNVSAARQVVSLKLPEKVDLNKINDELPEQIRVMGLKRVTKGFDSKSNCDGRTYMYMLPTFAFVPIDGQVTEAYRITPEVLENVRKTLKIFLGTKNFHNFTSRRKATDPSAIRYIMDFTCSDPFIKDNLEYVTLRVKGQSFMLHQIRKMIGLVTAMLRGFADMNTVEKTWANERIDIPKAPGVGLVLDEVHYDRYNERFGSDGMHEKLTWEEKCKEVDSFCQDFIYPIITKTENEEKSMFTWLETLTFHTYDVRDHGAPKYISNIGKASDLVHRSRAAADSSDEEDDDEDLVQSKRRKIDVKNTDD